MQAASIPPKFSIPFANAAGTGDSRPIPTASQITTNPGAASLVDGFPPLNFTPVAAGGIPPSGADFNGLFNQITKWNQWQGAGGPVKFDAAFSSSIGGYPAGARVLSNSGHAVYQSLSDNNTADPNTGSALWRVESSVWTAAVWQATGSANNQIITLNPVPTSLSQLIGLVLTVNSQGTNTGPVVLNPNGLGNIPVNFQAGVALGAGVLTTNAPFTVVYNGNAFVLTSHTNVFTDPGSGGITVSGPSSASGANLKFIGNGATTPNKWIRALNGVMQWVNSAYTAVTMTLDDVGNLTTAAGITATTGNIVANGGRLRAGLGAFGSADPNAATLLTDFPHSFAAAGVQVLPDGFVMQWNSGATTTGEEFVSFPQPFANTALLVIAQEANPQGWLVGGSGSFFSTTFGCQQLTASSFALYCMRTVPNAPPILGVGVAYRYFALGF